MNLEITHPEIYWSVENNSLGEASLIVIEEMDEDKFPGTSFYTNQRKEEYNESKSEKDFTTSYKTKITACMKMKSWMESDKMIPS